MTIGLNQMTCLMSATTLPMVDRSVTHVVALIPSIKMCRFHAKSVIWTKIFFAISLVQDEFSRRNGTDEHLVRNSRSKLLLTLIKEGSLILCAVRSDPYPMIARNYDIFHESIFCS